MSNTKSEFDLARARLLVGEISENLSRLPPDAARYVQLRAEVDALKAILEGPDAAAPQVKDRMKSVHVLFDRAAAELRADGMRAGVFASEIGRMIGLD